MLSIFFKIYDESMESTENKPNLIIYSNNQIKYIVFGYIHQFQKYFLVNRKNLEKRIKDICLAYFTVCDIKHYKELKVDPDSSMEEIKKAYKKRKQEVRQFSYEAQISEYQVSQDVDEAGKVLKDPTLREIYDELNAFQSIPPKTIVSQQTTTNTQIWRGRIESLS